VKGLHALLLTLFLSLSLAAAQGVGNQAPDFTLVDAEGEPVRLSELIGTPILLNFWATWCPPCREELPLFQTVADELNSDLQVLLVNNNEGRERAVQYLQANDIGLDTALDATSEQREHLLRQGIALDSTVEVMRRYRARGMPTTVFIDKDGIIRGVWVGLITPAKTAELLAEIGVSWQP
jgi:cytochrome c biogenesis protein CcmG, thiol:disulfide interchange protein DsbE